MAGRKMALKIIDGLGDNADFPRMQVALTKDVKLLAGLDPSIVCDIEFMNQFAEQEMKKRMHADVLDVLPDAAKAVSITEVVGCNAANYYYYSYSWYYSSYWYYYYYYYYW